jgi:hypothetical protein
MWSKRLDMQFSSPAAVLNTRETQASPRRGLQMFDIMAIPAGLLSLADAFLTQYLVGVGRVQEGNPLMAGLLESNHFLWFKVIGIAICLLLLWQVYKRFPRLAGGVALFITLFYSGVLIWNSSILSAV